MKMTGLVNGNPKAYGYLKSLDMAGADPVDKTAWELLNDVKRWELVTKSINDRFIRGLETIPGVDRGGRLTKIRRTWANDGRHYQVLGRDGNWAEPDEKVWVWAMVELERKR